jgi:hypothetical protein
MKSLFKVAVLVTWLACLQSARADFVAGNYDGTSATSVPGDYAGFLGGNSFALGQEFTAGATIGDLSLTVPFATVGTAQSYNLSIVTDNSGQPNTSSSIWSTTFNSSSLVHDGTADANLTFTLPTSTTVNSGDNYWVVLSQNGTLGGPSGVDWYQTTAASGDYSIESSSGANPPSGGFNSAGNGNALAFDLTTTDSLSPVPEPGQVAMGVLLLMGGSGYWIRRKLAAAQR